MPEGRRKGAGRERAAAGEAKRMDGAAFARVRAALSKSRKELADLLGLSLKAVESYEQGWRKVPAHVERVLYYLLFKLGADEARASPPCWTAMRCPKERRESCVAYLAKEGRYCWFFTGRLCAGAKARSESGAAAGCGLAGCYSCKVFAGPLAKAGVA